MRNFTPYYGVLAAALTLVPLGATAQTEGKQLLQKSRNEMMVKGHKVPVFVKMKASGKTSTPTLSVKKNAPKKTYGSETTYEEILTEDFDKLTKGSEDNPDSVAICDEYGYFGGPAQWDIDSQYTNTPGWCGSWVFQAGGKAYLNDPMGYIGAFLNSPLGDYSGNLTITVRVKAYGKYSSQFNLSVLRNGYVLPKFVYNDDGTTANTSVNLYPGKGWKVITFKVHNSNADNSGFIQLLSYGQCLVDYVHVTRDDDYIASPAMLPETNFTDSTFTANWEKVDMAYNYWTWIYKYAATGTEDRHWTADFESSVPEGFTTTGKLKAEAGADSSQALILEQGDTLVTPYNFSTYKNMKYWMQAAGVTEDELESADAKISIDLLTVNGWKEFGDFYAEYWTEAGDLDLDDYSYGKFNNQYFGVRIYPVNFPKGAYVALDNIDIQAGKDAELEPVGENEQYGYMFDMTKKTSYTFEGLDPEADYYYAIQSHYSKLFSGLSYNLAFGVAAPQVKPATDIDSRGSYTANWDSSVKATGYRVNNYGLTTAKEDGLQSVIDEDFSGITSDVTASTDPKNPEQAGTSKYESLNGYTKLPGWTVKNMAVTQGWMGAINDDYTTGIVKTPALYLDNADSFKLTIKAVGTAGDDLTIKTDKQTYYIAFDDNGEINGTYTIPESGSAVTLSITSDATFMIDNIKVSQELKAGDNIYTLLNSTTVDGKENTTTTFSNLYDYEFDSYAYAVTAIREDGSNYAESDLSDYATVDLENGTSQTTGIDQLDDAASVKVVGRYNVNGMRMSTPQRGVNIVKMSDGTVRKVLVK